MIFGQFLADVVPENRVDDFEVEVHISNILSGALPTQIKGNLFSFLDMVEEVLHKRKEN